MRVLKVASFWKFKKKNLFRDGKTDESWLNSEKFSYNDIFGIYFSQLGKKIWYSFSFIIALKIGSGKRGKVEKSTLKETGNLFLFSSS